MKEKLLSELKKRFTGQITEKFMDSLADRLLPKVKEEADIEGIVNELENSPIGVKDLQAEGDRRATEKQKAIEDLQKKLEDIQKLPEPPKPPATPSDEVKELREKVGAMERMISVDKWTSKLKAVASEKGIPTALLKNVEVTDEQTFNSTIETLLEDSKVLKQELIDKGEVGEPPRRSTGGANSEAIKQQIAEASKSIV